MARDDLERAKAFSVTRFCNDTRAMGDRIQVQQVLLNLVRNAAEAMAEIDGRRIITVSTAVDAAGDLVVSIEDTGPGLDPATVNKLFKTPFTTKPLGMGMGVAICRSIIEAHGRVLQAGTGAAGVGARFYFALPRSAPTAGTESLS